jgi:hypothetical protein
MFAYELPLSPPCDVWKEYELPKHCEMRIQGVCIDILMQGEKTIYQDAYDAIYQLVEASLEDERIEMEMQAYD